MTVFLRYELKAMLARMAETHAFICSADSAVKSMMRSLVMSLKTNSFGSSSSTVHESRGTSPLSVFMSCSA